VIQKFADGSDPIRFPNIQWADYIMKSSTLQSQHNLNISGGTDKVRYFISAGAYTQGGLLVSLIFLINFKLSVPSV
jgi:hypothetical protein